MLKVSKLTDYATAILMHMQNQDVMQSTDEISKITKLESPTVSKVLKLLTKAKILKSIRGANGGYLLADETKNISLFEIISAIEGPTAITECSKQESHCVVESDCGTKDGWQIVNQQVKEILLNMTIQRMAELKGASKPEIHMVIRD